MPPAMNFAIPPTRTTSPRTNNPIAIGRSLVGRGARGADSGVGGGGGSKLCSCGALMMLVSLGEVCVTPDTASDQTRFQDPACAFCASLWPQPGTRMHAT